MIRIVYRAIGVFNELPRVAGKAFVYIANAARISYLFYDSNGQKLQKQVANFIFKQDH